MDRETQPGPKAQVALACRPDRSANGLVFPYTVVNEGTCDVLVMDALSRIEPGAREPRADDQAAVVIQRGDGEAVIGKFVAPLPTDRRIASPLVPLARLLARGQTLTGELIVPLPLAETSPYFADARLRDYELVELRTVVFALCHWPAGGAGVVAGPVGYAPDHRAILHRDSAAAATMVWQRFPTKALHLLRRKDAFPRAVGRGPAG